MEVFPGKRLLFPLHSGGNVCYNDKKKPPGTKGVIQHIDDIGQIEVVWETGLTLRLVPDEDKFHIDNTPEPDMFEEQEAAEEEL